MRHIALNTLRSYRHKFKDKYGELVLCSDSLNTWRKQIFPFYKANRKKNRDASQQDWASIFSAMNLIKQELKTTFPYKFVEVETAEADDIIGVLVNRFGKLLASRSEEQLLIVSGDKDFIQLHKYANVEQWSPITSRFLRDNHPEHYLRTHILKGDRGDGIPNFLSADDTFVCGGRQRPLMKKNITKWANMKPEEFCADEDMLRGYKRNQQLIDLDYTPAELQEQINQTFDEFEPAKRNGLMNYFIKNRLKNLMTNLQEF